MQILSSVNILLPSTLCHIEISFFVWFTDELILAWTKKLFSKDYIFYALKSLHENDHLLILVQLDVILGYCVLVKLLFDNFVFVQVNHTKRDLHNFLIRKLYRCTESIFSFVLAYAQFPLSVLISAFYIQICSQKMICCVEKTCSMN